MNSPDFTRKVPSPFPPGSGSLKFFKSDTLLKLPSGKERAKPTLDKTVRVFRMFLVWAKDTGHLAGLPLPKDTPMGHSRVKEQDDAGQQ